MSKTIRMEEEDSNKITIPPLSIDEEGEEVIVDLNEAAGSEEKAPQEEVAESVDSTIKSIKPTEGLEKGVLQEDLFNTQRLLNGKNPSPKSVRQHSAKFRHYLTNYGSKGEDERLYLKVDSKKTLISKVMFNDDEEHSFLITSHVLHMDFQKNFFPKDATKRSIDLFTKDNEGIQSKEDIDWNMMLSFANFFPIKFLSILEEVFPYVTDAVKSAEVTKQILNQEVRFDLTTKSSLYVTDRVTL